MKTVGLCFVLAFILTASGPVHSGNGRDFPVEGQGAPAWYEASRVQVHTRLGPRLISSGVEAPPWYPGVFERAGRILDHERAGVLTRHVRTAGEPPPWEPDAPTGAALDKILSDTKQANLRTIAYFWHISDDKLAKDHPEYVCKDRWGAARSHRARGDYMDFQGPYGDIVAGRLEKLDKLGFDGVYLDERHYPPQGCFGGKVEKSFGRPRNWTDVFSYRSYLRTMRRYQGEAFARIALSWRQRLTDPEFAMVISVGPLPTLINSEMPLDLARTGIPKLEYNSAHRTGLSENLFNRYPELAGSAPSQAVRRAAALSILRNVSSASPHVWIHGLESERSLDRAVAQVITHGGIANVDIEERRIGALADIPSAHLPGDPLGPQVYRRLFADGAKVSPYFAGATLPRFVAIHFPEGARDALPIDDAWRRIVGPISQAFGGVMADGLPVDIIDDRILGETDLSGYAFLLTPQGTELTPSHKARLARSDIRVIRLPSLTRDHAQDVARWAEISRILKAGAGPDVPRLHVSQAGAEGRIWKRSGGQGFLASIVLANTGSERVLVSFDMPQAAEGYCAQDIFKPGISTRAGQQIQLDATRIWHVYTLALCKN